MHVKRRLLTKQSVVQCRTELHSASVFYSETCYPTLGADMHDIASYIAVLTRGRLIYTYT